MTIPTRASAVFASALLAAAGCTPAGDDPGSEPPSADQAQAAASDAAPHPEEAAVVAAVEQLFEAMRQGDGEMARAVLHPEARLGRANENGISYGPAEVFIERISSPRAEVWDEPIWDWTVQIDGRLAQMWTRYAFYLDDEFSHCGWEGFHLYRGETGWQITQLTDTMHRENCFYPPGREPAEEGAES